MAAPLRTRSTARSSPAPSAPPSPEARRPRPSALADALRRGIEGRPPPMRRLLAPEPPLPAGAPQADASTIPTSVPEGATHHLALALTDLAEVFAVYPFRSQMPVCSHCVSVADLQLLARQPARIPGPVLDRFVAKSLTTWGAADDLKRLVPEVFLRLADGRLGVPEPLVGARLRRAGWLDWPAAESPAVHRALRATWMTTLAAPPGAGRVPVIDRLGLVVSAEDDLGTYLELWEDRLEAPGNPTARLHAVLHLADLLAPFAEGRWRRLSRGFPLARRSVVSQLDHWLRQPVVVQRLAHAAEALGPTSHGPLVTRAREGLARLRTSA